MAQVFKLPAPIMVFTNPQELRLLADKMEQKQKTTKLGESCEVDVWRGDDYDIKFCFEQT